MDPDSEWDHRLEIERLKDKQAERIGLVVVIAIVVIAILVGLASTRSSAYMSDAEQEVWWEMQASRP
jgi:hypothetical protein